MDTEKRALLSGLANFQVVGYSEAVWKRVLRNCPAFALVSDCGSCIIRSGAEATSSEFCQKRKIPPPSSLDGRVGRKSPSDALNTSGSDILDAKTVRVVGRYHHETPSPTRIFNKSWTVSR